MRRGLARVLGPLVSGVLFGVGLCVSGMTRPEKVLAFLDIGGRFDPSLAFVMLGAIGVHAVLRRVVMARSAPLAASAFSLPPSSKVDARLVGGAAVFGVGWGLSGYCPGPSVVALSGGGAGVLAFVAALLAGQAAVSILEDASLTAGGPSPEAREG